MGARNERKARNHSISTSVMCFKTRALDSMVDDQQSVFHIMGSSSCLRLKSCSTFAPMTDFMCTTEPRRDVFVKS